MKNKDSPWVYLFRGLLVAAALLFSHSLLNSFIPELDDWWSALFKNYIDERFLFWGFSLLPSAVLLIFLGWLMSIEPINAMCSALFGKIPVVNIFMPFIFGIRINGRSEKISFSDIRKSTPALAELYHSRRVNLVFIMEREFQVGQDSWIVLFEPSGAIFPGNPHLVKKENLGKVIKQRLKKTNTLSLLLFRVTGGLARLGKLEKEDDNNEKS